ncbi:MAG TPA: hypothetical protein VH024_17620 [Candidatus Angelobacter sp.]|nr:hypothetical protein [Candidatus Angelobacter sp.]
MTHRHFAFPSNGTDHFGDRSWDANGSVHIAVTCHDGARDNAGKNSSNANSASERVHSQREHQDGQRSPARDDMAQFSRIVSGCITNGQNGSRDAEITTGCEGNIEESHKYDGANGSCGGRISQSPKLLNASQRHLRLAQCGAALDRAQDCAAMEWRLRNHGACTQAQYIERRTSVLAILRQLRRQHNELLTIEWRQWEEQRSSRERLEAALKFIPTWWGTG